MVQRQSVRQPDRTPRVARTALFVGFAFLTPLGMAAVPLGLWALMAGIRCRRRVMPKAVVAIGLGALSAFVTVTGWPVVFLCPPVFETDRQMQALLDNLAAGRYEAADASPLLRGGRWPPQAMTALGEDVNRHYGRGTLILTLYRSNISPITPTVATYVAYFDRGGLVTVSLWFRLKENSEGRVLIIGDERLN